MRTEIILIGPMNVGKSHISELLSQKLKKPHIKIDDIRFKYYEEIGYDQKKVERLGKEKGFFDGVYRYWKPFELHSIKRILKDFSDCIFDFGGGHSVYEDAAMLAEAKELLADFKNVILLLPTANHEESMNFFKTERGMTDEGALGITEHFLTHHSNYELCKHIIYVKNKSATEIVDEICNLL